MKNVLLALSLVIALSVAAGGSDSTFQRHMIKVSMTNAISQQFFKGPDGVTNSLDIVSAPGSIHQRYLPNYALHLRLNYSVGIIKMLRVETGIGYIFQGVTVKNGNSSSAMSSYTGSISVPIHIKLIKTMSKGSFFCTVGPDFILPVHNYYNWGNGSNSHERYKPDDTKRFSNLGVDLLMGYESRVSKNCTIDVGPAINFSGLYMFDKTQRHATEYYHHYSTYTFYAGLDVAFYFGVKK